MTARIVMPLLAMILIATACQTTASEPESVSTTGVIENTTLPFTTTTTPDEVTAASTTEPQPIHPVQVECSTELAAFPCSALIDGSLESEWQAPNGGIEARITFAFDHPYKITEIGFTNIPGAERFLRNGKIKDVSVALDDLLQVTYIRLDDDNAAIQWFSLRSLRTAILTVTITSAYPGVSVGESGPPFAELALAEITFMGTVVPDAGPPPTAFVSPSLEQVEGLRPNEWPWFSDRVPVPLDAIAGGSDFVEILYGVRALADFTILSAERYTYDGSDIPESSAWLKVSDHELLEIHTSLFKPEATAVWYPPPGIRESDWKPQLIFVNLIIGNRFVGMNARVTNFDEDLLSLTTDDLFAIAEEIILLYEIQP